MVKTKKEEPKTYSGCIVFNGTLELKLRGKTYKVRTEYCGLDLQQASQEHKIIMLLKRHLPYNEIDVGYLVRAKNLDKNHQFGFKVEKKDRWFSIYDYSDVVAWGYADGGCNSSHFNSCRMRPEEFPQFAGDPTSDTDEAETDRKGVVFSINDNGEIRYHAAVGEDEKMTNNATDLMRDCAKVFCDFRKQHPEVTEMHFYEGDE